MTGQIKKLLPKYAGPYRITKVLDNDRYVVEDVPGAPRSQKPYTGVYPGEKLRMYVTGVNNADSEHSSGEDTPPASPPGMHQPIINKDQVVVDGTNEKLRLVKDG